MDAWGQAQDVLKGDQRVISLWVSDAAGLGRRAPANYPPQIASKTAPADRRKAIGGWIEPSPAGSATASSGSPDPCWRQPTNPHPPPPDSAPSPGRFIEAHKKCPQFSVPALTAGSEG